MRALTSAGDSSSAQQFFSNGFSGHPTDRRGNWLGGPATIGPLISILSGVAVAAALILASADTYADAEFIALGSPSGGGSCGGESMGVSADGSVVVGTFQSASGLEACRWTEASGVVGLGDLPGGTFRSHATSVSADGSVVVGYSISSSGFEAFRWTQAGGMVGLGLLPGQSISMAYGASDDGSVVVGYSYGAYLGTEAFRWTSGGGIASLGTLSGDIVGSQAFGVSADGSVVVGIRGHNWGTEVFRWTEANGIVALGGLETYDGWSNYVVSAMSADGKAVVGYGSDLDAPRERAFLWTLESGVRYVGHGNTSRANAVSADGSVVVGGYEYTHGDREHLSVYGISGDYGAFVWDESNGFRNLQQVLITDYGLGDVLTGRILRTALGISADGKTIVGDGWLVRLDPPIVPNPTVHISLSQLSVDTNLSLAGAQADNEIHDGDLSNKPHIEYQQLVAVIGDGDGVLGQDEVGYNLSDCGYGGRVTSLKTHNDAADPVMIRASGRVNNNTDGDLTQAVRFSNERGFGLDNGPDGEGMARWLNGGDAIAVQVNAAGGSTDPALRTLVFVVNVRDDAAPGATVGVVLDVDGDLLADTNGPAKQGGFVTDGLLTLPGLADGAKVRIDFVNRLLRVDDVIQAIGAAFWQAFDDAGGDRLTIGAEAGDGTGFAVKGMTLETVLD